MDLNGSRAVVTGGSRGIGESIAQSLRAAGAHVVLVARNAELLEKTAASMGASWVAADLADPAAVVGLEQRCADAVGGPIDVLVNNAGIDEIGLLTDKSAADVTRIHQVNLLTPIELTRQALPGMLSRGRGTIVNVSSLAGTAGFAGMSLYCSTKAGLTNFTRILHLELKGTPVRTLTVELGPIPTDMLDGVNKFAPVEKSFERFRRLQLMPNIPREKVANEIIDALRAGRAHVRLPKRAALYPMLSSAPQRMAEAFLVGIPNR